MIFFEILIMLIISVTHPPLLKEYEMDHRATKAALHDRTVWHLSWDCTRGLPSRGARKKGREICISTWWHESNESSLSWYDHMTRVESGVLLSVTRHKSSKILHTHAQSFPSCSFNHGSTTSPISRRKQWTSGYLIKRVPFNAVIDVDHLKQLSINKSPFSWNTRKQSG